MLRHERVSPAGNEARTRLIQCILAAALLLTSTLPAGAQTKTNRPALQALAAKFQQDLQSKRPQLYYDLLKSTDPAQRALNENPDIQLMYISPSGMPRFYHTNNLNAARTISTDDVWPGGSAGYSLNGSSTAAGELGIWDAGGVRTTHQEVTGRVIQQDGPIPLHYHSTHVAGTMVASGVVGAARGMSYQAHLDAYDWDSDTAEMALAAAAGMQVSNHSYNFTTGWSLNGSWFWHGDLSVNATEDYGFGFYSTDAQAWDQIAYNAPFYLICKSSGNDRNDDGPTPGGGHYHWNGAAWVWATDTHQADGASGGYDTIAWLGNAKNILTVGAVEDIASGWTAPGDVVQTAFSSWGPTDDGRIKPDVVANGANLYSINSTADNAYQTLSGTSMSTPNVSGSVNLLAEMFIDEYDKRPLSSTMKALVINTADEAGSFDGPDYRNGWGLMSTHTAADVIAAKGVSDMGIAEATLGNGETWNFYFTKTTSGPVHFTIAWTDPPGTPPSPSLDPSTPMLVNDLDVRIYRGAGTYYPWRLSRTSPSSAATKGDNSIDNVEQIDIGSAPADDYIVTITHKGTLSGGSQDYSMVWRGLTPVSPPVPVSGAVLDLTPPGGVTPNLATGGNDFTTRGVYVTAIKDFNVTGLSLEMWLPNPQDVTATIYEANGTTRGAMIAQNTVELFHPGQVTKIVPITASLQACQEYEITIDIPNVVSWPWWSESASHPPAIAEPFDVGGVIRVRDGSSYGSATNYALPHFSIVGSVPGGTVADVVPPVPDPVTSTDGSTRRGAYVTAEQTTTLHSVGFDMAAGIFEVVRLTARVYEASGRTRGDLIAEGHATFLNTYSGSTLRYTPVDAVLAEGHDYDIEVEYPSRSSNGSWTGYWENDNLPFSVDGVIKIVEGELAGNYGNLIVPHMAFRYSPYVGGEPYDITTPFLGEAHLITSGGGANFGHYVTCVHDEELYSVGWLADISPDEFITVNVYEASGTSRGSLISSGTISATTFGTRWHDVPVSASLIAGHDYDISIDWTTAPSTIFQFWSTPMIGQPWNAYGFLQVAMGESGGTPDPYNEFIQMRVNVCTADVTGIADGPTHAPKFMLGNPYPNPTRAVSTIDFSLDEAGPVTMAIYDVAGRKVATIIDHQRRDAGPAQVTFDTGPLPAGVYFVKLQTALKSVTRKIAVVR